MKLEIDISVDCVIFGYHQDALKVLLIKQKPPAMSNGIARYALPGDLVLENEHLDNSASRVLKELPSI